MKKTPILRHFCILTLLLVLLPGTGLGQAENVPANHPVYTFLKRMSVKRMIERYSETVLPMGRRDVAGFLTALDARRKDLSGAEQKWLDDYLSEFQYDITGNTDGFYRLIDPEDQTEEGGDGGSSSRSVGGSAVETAKQAAGGATGGFFSNREKYLYHYNDSTLSFFMNGLVDLDARGIRGDDLNGEQAQYLQVGGRIRGSIWGRLGYYVQLTNAGFRGSRELLARDPLISQSHELRVGNARNFDFGEGYLRYDGGVVSAQVGRERVLWGSGYGERLTASDNVRLYDFIRADAHYKAIRYTFMHAWLAGQVQDVRFTLPFDTSATFVEPVASDKYFASHRIEVSFPKVLDFGFQEMIIYSNRAPDLAYMNPITVFEPVQRARGERDNNFWLFDLRTHFIPGLELTGTIMYDDINIPDLFSKKWRDRYALQAGMFYADVFGIANTSLMVEYTRIEPYVFTHDRSRDNSYTSMGRLLGSPMGPNTSGWFFRLDYLPGRNLYFSARVHLMKKGLNVTDSTGRLVRNVGGDVFQPHRPSDPELKSFLDGVYQRTGTISLLAAWECFNQFWLEGKIDYTSIEQPVADYRNQNSTWTLHVRWEL